MESARDTCIKLLYLLCMKKDELNIDDTISKKKKMFPIGEELRKYLTEYSRDITIPITYQDLRHFSGSVAVRDKKGKDTLVGVGTLSRQ
jgi:hypothetical protein